ncbi:cytochrome P450 [Dimargaris cristalligena]|uniref:Cytochrome P450 n=1 Tax=Dimargaris cristalligena TaxID=215637 RepID=A0A4Q0A0N4_9FUNG|nr:cytochrome P450 [Dimargaris cristalligena]|eukprot:RKP39656.1 cytochrome P450 [Dimargaris cristalligena]
MLQWVLESMPRERADWKYQVVLKMTSLSFASLHTTTMMFHNLLARLASRPDLRARLRAEQARVLAEFGTTATPTAVLDAMDLLDACIQECARLHFGVSTFQRVVATTDDEITLNHGRTTIPAGATVLLSPVSINMDPLVYGPDVDQFRPDRFLELTQAHLKKSTTVRSDFLMWGSGRHACPGRFLAISEIKRMACILLRSYDFETVSGKPFEFSSLFLGNIVRDQPVRFTRIVDLAVA